MQEYIVIEANSNNLNVALDHLEKKVNVLLKSTGNREKYALQGGISITFSPNGDCVACQAMLKTTSDGNYEGHA